MPYFKDIYNDLAEKSDKKTAGINKIIMTDYASLPGILSERFFAILDANGDQYVDQKEFIHAMLKIYYSKLESKIKLVFDFYDFDKDGFISKEDIRLILSHIPMEVFGKGKVEGEGKFTQEGGSNAEYADRIEM